MGVSALIALIHATVYSYMVLHTVEEPEFDFIQNALLEYNAACNIENAVNTWKLLTYAAVSLVLLDCIPFVASCILNGAIIYQMTKQAEIWGREDPQKLVEYKFVPSSSSI